jgi:predicted transcriptional regulator YdeE
MMMCRTVAVLSLPVAMLATVAAWATEIDLDPRIVDLPELTLVGIVQGAPDVGKLDIAGMWERFGDSGQDIQGAVEGTAYELHIQTMAEPCMHYCLVGVQVLEPGPVPEEMFTKVLPPCKYAVFTHRVVDGYGVLYDRVTAWFAASEYEEAHPYDFQRYDSRFTSMDDPESVQDVYIPVRIR